MNSKIIILCCLATGLAAETKISLEDIERDNISNERKSKGVTPPATTSPSPTKFGFVPLKTANDYSQQQATGVYPYQQQYITQQQYIQPQQQYSPQQYASTQQYLSSPSRYQSRQQHYVFPQVQQQQQQQYIAPSQQYQQYENVQYVTDNSIGQAQQQYYNNPQQYVYLQQYTSPSNAIQTVVDPKGGLQYIMYIPTYVPNTQAQEQTQIYENVAADVPSSTYEQVIPQTQVQQEVQYITKPSLQYVSSKKEPKSLLDSYVPSLLQLQFYKQQQARANALSDSAKLSSPVIGKTDYVKGSSYRLPQSSETTLNYNFQLPAQYRTLPKST